MGIRIRKSIKLGKHARLNLSKSGMSISTGLRGVRVSLNNKGKIKNTVGVPGTGIYYSEQYELNSNTQQQDTVNSSLPKTDINTKGKWLPIWLSNWVVISFLMMMLGFIGVATNGFLLLFLPVAFISLLSSLIVYLVKYMRYLKRQKDY